MRDNWSEQSFESVSNTNQNEMQGMRNSEHFALGKFSAQTGIHTMGVRAYDPARGLWLSPDLYIGQSLEKMAGAGQEANLFQYAANSPTSKNDVAGMDTEEGNESGGGSYGRGSNFSNGGGGYSLGNDMEGHGPNYGMSSSYYGGQNFGSRSFSPSADKDLGNEGWGLAKSWNSAAMKSASSQIEESGITSSLRGGGVSSILEEGVVSAVEEAPSVEKVISEDLEIGKEVISEGLNFAEQVFSDAEGKSAVNHGVNPADIEGKTPQEIHDYATSKGLIPKGPDPMNNRGAYLSPETGERVIESHPNDRRGQPPHAHVYDSNDNRLGVDGKVYDDDAPEAHIPIKRQ